MSSNPFRARNLGNPTDSATLPSQSSLVPVPPQPPSALASGYGKSSISLEREVDDSSSETNPFNPDLSASDSEDETDGSRGSAFRDDDRPASFGSAPPRAPLTDGPFISTDHKLRSARDADGSQHVINATSQSSLESDANHSLRAKDKKPPPPPPSHHGRRIGTVTADSSRATRSRSSNRLSIHNLPGNVTPGASHPSSVSLPSATDYFSPRVEDQRPTGSTESLQRSQSQHKRPPTPPLSRRHSQMRRSKSTQSKPSSRLSMSFDSESTEGSLPPSPGPSSRAVERKRVSMPPPSSGDFQGAAPLGDVSLNLSINSRPPSLKAGRRASSYGHTPASSTGPPPPPPPRRTRDSLRSSDLTGSKENQTPFPQPSNALDILADLTRLQKEVDDLRGHYENRKIG